MKRILLLEDDLSLGETIKELLLENDYEVDYVTKGNDVIEITFDKEYDLIYFIRLKKIELLVYLIKDKYFFTFFNFTLSLIEA